MKILALRLECEKGFWDGNEVWIGLIVIGNFAKELRLCEICEMVLGDFEHCVMKSNANDKCKCSWLCQVDFVGYVKLISIFQRREESYKKQNPDSNFFAD